MTLKEFLKPSLGKIVISSIFILIEIYSLYNCYTTANAASCGSLSFMAPVLIGISFPFIIFNLLIQHIFGMIIALLLTLLILIIIIYLIVCCISWIIEKIRKVKK